MSIYAIVMVTIVAVVMYRDYAKNRSFYRKAWGLDK